MHRGGTSRTSSPTSWYGWSSSSLRSSRSACSWWCTSCPEKIAEKKGHPQLDAIKMLCLLSLVFGGILWPLAWIWAVTKPVMHKLAYGTDEVFPEGHEPATPADAAGDKA